MAAGMQRTFQFGLRTLFVLTTLACVFFVFPRFVAMWAALLLMILLAASVFGFGSMLLLKLFDQSAPLAPPADQAHSHNSTKNVDRSSD